LQRSTDALVTLLAPAYLADMNIRQGLQRNAAVDAEDACKLPE